MLIFANIFSQLHTNIFEIQILFLRFAYMFFGLMLASLLTNRLDQINYSDSKRILERLKVLPLC